MTADTVSGGAYARAARGKRRELGQGSRDRERLESRLRRFCCSVYWELLLLDEVRSNRIPFREKEQPQRQTFGERCIYPPGGANTAMHLCTGCDRWYPPQAVRFITAQRKDDGTLERFDEWQPQCIDCYYCGMPLDHVSQLPSSPSVYMHSTAEAMAAGLSVSGIRRHRVLCKDKRGYSVAEQVVDEAGVRYDLVPPPAPKSEGRRPAA